MSEQTGTFARSMNMAATIIAQADTSQADLGQVAEWTVELGVLLFNLQDTEMETRGLYDGKDSGAKTAYKQATSKPAPFGGSSNGSKTQASGSSGMSDKQRATIRKNLARIEDAGLDYHNFDYFASLSGRELSDAIGELFNFVNANV